jgi:2'-5' RNA ligase
MAKHDYASTQFDLPPSLAEHVKKAGGKIPDWALAEEGRETKPHVTVKYGLHGDDPAPVRDVLRKFSPFTVRMGNTSHFPDSGSGDVVKADVHSQELHKLHHAIADSIRHTDTHPDYHPHVTLAYVKRGLGRKFATEDGHSLRGKEATVDHVIFSDRQGKRTKIHLGKENILKRLKVDYA